jgi:hypothetical protein
MLRTMWHGLVLVGAVLLGCGGGGGEQETSTDDSGAAATELLWDHQLWESLGPGDDPFIDHRPGAVVCNPLALSVEMSSDGLELDVETADCPYLAYGQPSRVAVAAGEALRLEYRHFDLTAPEPAEAHVAVVLNGSVVHEAFIEIPGDASVETLDLVSPIDAPVGSPLVLHLHNHGQNSWIFGGLTRVP